MLARFVLNVVYYIVQVCIKVCIICYISCCAGVYCSIYRVVHMYYTCYIPCCTDVSYLLYIHCTGVFYRDEALAAMTKWHKYTCVRFVPWLEGETMQKYGLPKESHVTITKGDG